MEISSETAEKKFISNPKVMENYSFLQEIGVFTLIDTLLRSIHHYRALLTKGLDIFNRSGTSEILDATVAQISYSFLPSYIVFLWKPVQNRPDVSIRTYHNYKSVDFDLKIDSIDMFEDYFLEFPQAVNFRDFEKKINNDEALKQYQSVQPEIIIPILGPFGLYGIILVGQKFGNEVYTGEELEFFQQLMSFVSQAIKNHLHYEHSLHDVKTGLYNHGFFMTRLKDEVNRLKNGTGSFAVIVIDVDTFKNFNDTFGHLAGDQVLEKLAQVLRQNVRENDIPSRFGGEEFTIMLPHTDADTAWAVAEQLRTSVADMRVPWEVPLPQVTISLGIFVFNQDNDLGPTDILRRADEALYVSKNRGRNCCTLWEPGLIITIPDMALRSY